MKLIYQLAIGAIAGVIVKKIFFTKKKKIEQNAQFITSQPSETSNQSSSSSIIQGYAPIQLANQTNQIPLIFKKDFTHEANGRLTQFKKNQAIMVTSPLKTYMLPVSELKTGMGEPVVSNWIGGLVGFNPMFIIPDATGKFVIFEYNSKMWIFPADLFKTTNRINSEPSTIDLYPSGTVPVKNIYDYMP